MPVQATPTTPTVVTLDDIRGFLRDRTDYNILLDGVEFTDTDIDRAVRFTVAKFNATDRVTNESADTINPYILMVGATAWLLRSEAHKQVRNQATYQDGDIAPIGVDDKQALYAGLAADLRNEFTEMVVTNKMSTNLDRAYDCVGSGYRNVSRFHNQ